MKTFRNFLLGILFCLISGLSACQCSEGVLAVSETAVESGAPTDGTDSAGVAASDPETPAEPVEGDGPTIAATDSPATETTTDTTIDTASIEAAAATLSLTSGCGDVSFTATPTDIGAGLPGAYEPSDNDWHDVLNRLFVVSDEGVLSMMTDAGSSVTSWTVGGDLEGVTVANAYSHLVYIGQEIPNKILEFDVTTGAVTRSFDLSPWMLTADLRYGLEALTFVPDSTNAEGGLFYAGHQGEGIVYVFSLPIVSSTTSTTVTYVRQFTPVSGRTDISGLDYDADNSVIFVEYDANNKVDAVTSAGTLVKEWTLPQLDQEGFARNGACDIFISQDSAKSVWRYAGAGFSVTQDQAALDLLADRVVTVQNDDGSFDWQQDVSLPLTPTTTGYQNVTGVSVWGLQEMAELVTDVDQQQAIDDAVDYFDGRLDALIADPYDTANNLSCPNWTVLARYLQTYADATLEARVVQAFDLLLNARDDDFGDVTGVRVDGVYNRMSLVRASIPGLIPWDMGLCAEALQEMAVLDSSFDSDAQDALDLLADYVDGTFLPDYRADSTLEYGDISLAMPLFVLAKAGRSEDAGVIIDLAKELEALVAAGIPVTNGTANDGPQQVSAYALLALKQIRSASAQAVQTYLEDEIGAGGMVFDIDTNLETYEVEGEMLRALAYRP